MERIKQTSKTPFVNLSLERLSAWLENYGLKGYDPYDGLNSLIFQWLPFKPRMFRLAWIQFFKRCPINLRTLVLVPKTQNPKTLALLVDGWLCLYRISRREQTKRRVIDLLHILEKNAIPGYSGFCWGYPFDWQSRLDFKPRGTPTVVTTAFVANAFLHAYLQLGDETYLKVARSACDFILHDLNQYVDEKGLCFSYSPFDQAMVHNANMLAAHLLARVYRITKENELLQPARQAVQFVLRHQHPNGSWNYGTASFQRWIDHFHTGYILEFLNKYIQLTGEVEWQRQVKNGLAFYVNHLFLPDGRPKYYAHKTYPIDIHCCAQAILTLGQLQHMHEKCTPLLEKVIRWTVSRMQSPHGYFYYQKHRWFTIKIPYLRWGQAWMFKALSFTIAREKMMIARSGTSHKALVLANS